MTRHALAAVLLVALAVGCSRIPLPPPPAAPAAGLTADERIEWRKAQRGNANCHAIYILHRGSWKSHVSDVRPLNHVGDIGQAWCDDARLGLNGFKDALEVAETAARLPANRAVAVVDLFNGEDPVPVKWLWDDSTGLKTADQPPDPAWATALRAHLVAVQKSAAR